VLDVPGVGVVFAVVVVVFVDAAGAFVFPPGDFPCGFTGA
jgi:hypothetical protein